VKTVVRERLANIQKLLGMKKMKWNIENLKVEPKGRNMKGYWTVS
jgi:hypothetical protein